MRNQLKTVYSALALVAMLGLTSTVHGIPAFARQTGLDCNSCHASPGYPALNTFGQAFKAGGYTQANEDELMGDGEALSIPKTLNMAVVFKLNDILTLPSGGAAATNEVNLPDETALFTGGRVGKNIGYLIEMGAGDILGTTRTMGYSGFKLVFAPDLGPLKLGIVPYYNDGVGPAYAFETLSTANADMIRITEAKEFTSAQAALDWGGNVGGAGLGIYVWHPFGFIAYSPFVSSVGTTVTADIGHYIRAAVTPSFSGFDLALGWTGKFGKGSDDVAGTSHDYNYMAIDFQAMATLGIPLALIATWANDGITSTSAFSVAVDAQLVQDMLNVVVGYCGDLSSTSQALGGAANNVGLAVKFQVARNIRLHVDTWFNLNDSSITILPGIFGAF